MGGGRCHFQDCKQRNDGVIHMFRYPVFDKVRCHRWLVATGRMDLLKLKVSQVRNKQICQHHFQDEDFMNAKKNSLKPAAIPILGGPFCMELDETGDPDDFPLTVDQIENEIFMPKDLKPESLNSKLYDYLTTSELEGLSSPVSKPETQNVSLSSYDYLSKIRPIKDQIVIIRNPDMGSNKRNFNNVISAANMAQTCAPKKIAPPKMVAPKNIDVQEILQEFDEKPNFTILSQKTVSSTSNLQTKPIKLAELKRIDPVSHVINRNSLLKKESIDLVKSNEKDETLEIEIYPNNDNIPFAPVRSVPTQNDKTPIVIDTPKSLITEEVKVPQLATPVKQKSTDIQEKRTFNRRLRDIIRESIDMADSRTPKEDEKTFVRPSQETKTVNVSVAPKKDNFSTIEPMIAISLLQNRLQAMEALLLNRIDANTKEVYELKKLLLEKSKAEKVIEKEITVETSHEARKKRLFSEVSEYLSREGKSALYEQLFVSKYTKRTKR